MPTLAGAPWLVDSSTSAVLAAIAVGGYRGRVVGGAVRNALFGLPVTDIDIATDAAPDEVMRLAAASGLATVATGLAHGTVTVLSGGQSFEVTTLRADVETDGRHATVAFTSDWAADAARRDFTINALYCDADGIVFDPLGGFPDLLARRVRFIGDAAERIREDFLRILRFFRFTAQYAAGPPDATGLDACVRERSGISRLSGERLRQEMMRLLIAPRALDGVTAMREYGLLSWVLPVAPRPTLLARLIAIEAHLGLDADAALRLAALAVETADDADRLTCRLRLSTAERNRLLEAPRLEAHLRAPIDVEIARALLYRNRPDSYQAVLALAWARDLGAPTDDPGWSQLLTLPRRWVAPTFPLRGADVIALGVAPGRQVGEILRRLEAWWIDEDFRPDRDAALRRLARTV